VARRETKQGVEYEAVGPDEQTDGGPKQNGHDEPDESQQESLDSSTETESDTDADIVEPDDVGVPKDEGESPAELAERVSPVKTDSLSDPLATVPDWMKTEIQHRNGSSVDLNKRGTQVIARALDLVVTAECEVSAYESDFEYARYRASVRTPEGNLYNAVGDAHIKEQGNNREDLERLAETRAKKRCVKWVTGGGIEALVGGDE